MQKKKKQYLDPVPELLGQPVLLPVLGHAPRHLLLQHLHNVHELDDLDPAAAGDGDESDPQLRPTCLTASQPY